MLSVDLSASNSTQIAWQIMWFNLVHLKNHSSLLYELTVTHIFQVTFTFNFIPGWYNVLFIGIFALVYIFCDWLSIAVSQHNSLVF